MQPYKVWLFSDLIEKTNVYLKFLYISVITIGLIFNAKNFIKIFLLQMKEIINISLEQLFTL